MENTKFNTYYLWGCSQSEPGIYNPKWQYTLTADTKNKPEAIEPLPVYDGLAFQESFYGEWKIIGTVQAKSIHFMRLREDWDIEDWVVQGVKNSPKKEEAFAADEIFENHFYTKIK